MSPALQPPAASSLLFVFTHSTVLDSTYKKDRAVSVSPRLADVTEHFKTVLSAQRSPLRVVKEQSPFPFACFTEWEQESAW